MELYMKNSSFQNFLSQLAYWKKISSLSRFRGIIGIISLIFNREIIRELKKLFPIISSTIRLYRQKTYVFLFIRQNPFRKRRYALPVISSSLLISFHRAGKWRGFLRIDKRLLIFLNARNTPHTSLIIILPPILCVTNEFLSFCSKEIPPFFEVIEFVALACPGIIIFRPTLSRSTGIAGGWPIM